MKKLWLVPVCVLILLLLGGISLRSSLAEPQSLPQEGSDPMQTDRVTRILVMGSDRAAGLTDSIFVVTLNETAHRATVLQLPRDTYANYTQKDYKKLNGAYRELGAEGVKNLLSEALGVPIHHTMVLDLDGLQAMVDAVGGVDLVLPQAMEYADPAQGLEIRLPAGAVHLDGLGAEQLVRYRSGYVNADLGRLDAQKLFLQAFAAKCKTLSPAQAMRLLEPMLKHVKTDLDLPNAIRLVSVLRDCDAEHIPMATLAGEAVQGVSGAWYYCLCRSAACRMANEYLLPEQMIDLSEFDPKGLFDRVENENFHKIYTAPDAMLREGG